MVKWSESSSIVLKAPGSRKNTDISEMPGKDQSPIESLRQIVYLVPEVSVFMFG